MLDERILVIPHSRLRALGLPYIDLLAAMDVVLCKTGYGVVSELIATGMGNRFTHLFLNALCLFAYKVLHRSCVTIYGPTWLGRARLAGEGSPRKCPLHACIE